MLTIYILLVILIGAASYHFIKLAEVKKLLLLVDSRLENYKNEVKVVVDKELKEASRVVVHKPLADSCNINCGH